MSMSYGGDTIQDTDGGVLRPISSVMRNRIINGAMVIDQRNAGASTTVAANPQYTLDQWRASANPLSKYSVQQNAGSVTPPAGFTNYLGVTSLSAYSVSATEFQMITNRIEGFNVADLGWGTANAKTVTLSFWVRSSLTGTFGGSFQNSGNDRSYPYSYTISSANTWEYKTITVAGDTSGTWLTDNGIGIQVRFGLGVGSTFSGTAGSWSSSNYFSATGATSVVGTNGATFYITGVQLEVGSSATGFEYRQYGQELALCQRYYETSFNPSVAPANGIYTQTSLAYIAYADQWALATPFIPFKVTKRASPTMTQYGQSNGVWQNYNPSGGWLSWAAGSPSDGGQGAQAPTATGFSIYTHNNGNSGLPVGYARAMRGDWAASAEL